MMAPSPPNVRTEWVSESFGHSYRGECFHRERSAYQTIEVWRNDTLGVLLFLDGKLQVSEADENRYHQHLVSAPLLMQAAPESMCIIGGGDCFGIEEAVKFPSLRRVVQVEIDQAVIDVSRRFFPCIERSLLDPRVEIVIQDGRAWLAGVRDRFDLIVLDLTEPHGPATLLYTREFYRSCRAHLTSGGILSIHADDYALYPRTFSTIAHTLASVFSGVVTARVDMPSFGMDWTFRAAGRFRPSLRRLARNLATFAAAGVSFDQLNPSLYAVAPGPEEREVLRRYRALSTDQNPHDKFAEAGPSVLDVGIES
jgi:spermidine synthase